MHLNVIQIWNFSETNKTIIKVVKYIEPNKANLPCGIAAGAFFVCTRAVALLTLSMIVDGLKLI